MNKIKGFISTAVFVLCVLTGCASLPGVKGKGTLCGLVIDNNNYPVSDFVVEVYRNGVLSGTTMTGENGVFVLENMPKGTYEISGEKPGFVRLYKAQYNFVSEKNMFCCQINTFWKNFYFITQSIDNRDYKEALHLLDVVCVDEKTEQGVVVAMYKALLYIQFGEVDKADKEIKNAKKKYDGNFMLENDMFKQAEETVNKHVEREKNDKSKSK